LKPSTVYIIKVDVLIQIYTQGKSSVAKASDRLTFTTGQSGISAIISGGTQQQLSPDDNSVFDASSSFDADYPTSERLFFMWSCIQYSPNYGTLCDLCQNDNSSTLSFNLCPLPTGSYNISVVVSNSHNVRASTFVFVTVSNYSAPRLAVGNVAVKYNPNYNVVLSGYISSAFPCSARWSSTDIPSQTLDTISLTSLTRTVPSGSTLFQLSIQANSLSGGVTYTFQLLAAYSG